MFDFFLQGKAKINVAAELQRVTDSRRVEAVRQTEIPPTPPFLSLACSQKERERIIDNKRQVQSLVNKSKTIVRLKPRNPEEKSSSPVMVQALCDFKQEQVGYMCSLTPKTC